MHYRRCPRLVISGLALAATLLSVVSCSKTAEEAAAAPKPAAPEVPAAGLSPATKAISSHLEFGGEFYVVMDTQGDIQKVGDMMADFLGYAMQEYGRVSSAPLPANFDYRGFLKKLGLYDLGGLGMSSWKGTDGLHHNRSFIYTPNGRTGLLKLFGDKPGPFITPNLAPADADLVGEVTLNLKTLEEQIVSYAQDIGGPATVQEVTDALKMSVPGTTLTGQSLVDRLNTRYTFILRADTKQVFDIGAGRKMPMTDFLIAIDGFADVLDQLIPLIKDNPMATVTDKNGLKMVTIQFPIPAPFSSYKPVILADSKTKRLYLASRESFVNETVNGQGARLATSEDFKLAIAGMPTEGNSLGYLSKKGAGVIAEYYQKQAMSNLPATLRDDYFDYFGVDKIPHGIASVYTNLPDGMLTQNVSSKSINQTLMAVPVIALLAMTAGAQSAIAAQSQVALGAVAGAPASPVDRAIRNNLRQISNAAQQYMLDKGVTEVRFQDLISGPTPYLRSVTSAAGENYNNLIIRQTSTRISVTKADGTVVSFDM